MSGELRIVGATPSENLDMATREYVSSLQSEDMSTEAIDDAVSSALTGYATKEYVDEQDALNATKEYVDAGDESRLHIADRNAPDGVAGLDALGRIERSRINVTSTQKMAAGLWVPSSYGSNTTALTTAEVLLFSTVVTNPGHPYRLVVMGNFSGRSNTDGAAPVVRVRVGAPDGHASGQIIAQGIGSTESYDYLGIDHFSRTGGTLGSGWEESWTGSGSGHAETNGSAAVYKKDGYENNRIGYFRRLGNDALTAGDYQQIEWVNDSDCDDGNDLVSFLGVSGRNLALGRMSEDMAHWTGFAIDAHKARFAYRVAGGDPVFGDPVDCESEEGNRFTIRLGTSTSARHFQLLRDGVTVMTHHDSGAVTSMGATRRGWGFGFRAGNHEFLGFPTEQAEPASLRSITISDSTPGVDLKNYTSIPIMPVSMSTQSVRTGETVLYITISSTTGSAVNVGYDHSPSLSILALPA